MPDPLQIRETACIGPVTGPGSPGRIDTRFAICGADLGIAWAANDGRTGLLFGDTFGAERAAEGAGPASADWRCNALGFSSTRELADGLVVDSVIQRADGTAAQVIASDDACEHEATVVPNGAITVAGVYYAHYMSVREWGDPGRWQTNYAGIAVSENGGHDWHKPGSACWQANRPGEDRFQIGAFARDETHVYLFGTTSGRDGPVYLARAAPERLLEVRDYVYFDGHDWASAADAAAPVLTGPAGELSVAFNRAIGRWLALHLDEARAAIVLHAAPAPVGPWEEVGPVATGDDYPGLYGGYLHPASMTGHTIYFLMSQWAPYNVFLMRCTLEAGAR